MIYDRIWRVRTVLPERRGQRLRLLVRARVVCHQSKTWSSNTALVEFADGYRVVTSVNYFRRACAET